MSHQPERKEKDCLNCGTQVHGRFCHHCGQENIVTHQSFWALTKHFVYDIFHFDGKFFHTLAYIFVRPGFVARQYVEGKRMSYLDPIRMYLFTSAIFFLIFFSVNKIKVGDGKETQELTNEDRIEMANDYEEMLEENPADSALKRKIALLRDTANPVSTDTLLGRKSTFSFDNTSYSSLQEYDSIQAALPVAKKDGWLERRLMRQIISINERYGYNEKAVNIFLEIFLHKLPYLLFLSLPFFALILKLLYKRRKNFYYSDHAIFTLYHYIFSFILLLLIFGVGKLQDWTGWGLFSFLFTVLLLYWPVYLLIEMRSFYRQGWGKTLGKFLLLNLTGLFILILLFIIFLLFSIFQM